MTPAAVTGDRAAAAFARRQAPTRAVADQAGAVARACRDMAGRFHGGGKLLVFGSGTRATDAQHVSVEFVHPVIVGKRALPALTLATDAATVSGLALAAGPAEVFSHQLRALAAPADIALGLYGAEPDPAVTAGLREARGRGLLSVALAAGGPGVVETPVDHLLSVPSEDPRIAKEVQVTLYHVLWELVHIFFERPGALPTPGPPTCVTCSDQAQAFPVVSLLEGSLAMVDTGQGLEKVSIALVDACVGDRVLVHAGEAIAVVPPEEGEPACPAGPAEPPGEDLSSLYPFLYEERDADPDAVLGDVARSTAAKAEEIALLRQQVGEAKAHRLAACASAMAQAFAGGGRLLAFGNGGSSSDAQAVAHAFLDPPAGERPLPALSLTNDIAVVTALANDIGFEVVFARQVAAWGRPGDIAVALSTSGGSANVLAGIEEAKRAGMLTVGLAGYDGGKMAEAALDFLFVIPSSSVHRIQEAQTTVYHVLAELTQAALAAS